MAFFDYPEEKLRTYMGQAVLPADFEAFWRSTLDTELARDLDIYFERVDLPLTAYEVYDLSYLGYGGARIHTWVRIPAHHHPLATVVNFIGYNGSRGYPWRDSLFAQAGYIHVTMDSRSQGWRTPHFGVTTDDPDLTRGVTAVGGVMTAGVLDKDTYYYRRIYTDTVRCLQAVLTLDNVDADHIFVCGGSQGGGLTLAAGALAGLAGIHLAGAMPDVAFLCDFPRAVGLTDEYPYREITDYLRANPQFSDQVFDTLSYFDGVNMARFASAPGLFSTALMDMTCPPSTVFAAFNNYQTSDKQIQVWPWNDHEGGTDHQALIQLTWMKTHLD